LDLCIDYLYAYSFILLFTELECPFKVCKQVPDFTSQIRIDLSSLPDTILSPSGEKATLLTYVFIIEKKQKINKNKTGAHY
jgi:hypothetical protein